MRYSDAVRGTINKPSTQIKTAIDTNTKEIPEGTGDLKHVLQGLKEINKIIDLEKFDALLLQKKTELQSCNMTIDKLMVLVLHWNAEELKNRGRILEFFNIS